MEDSCPTDKTWATENKGISYATKLCFQCCLLVRQQSKEIFTNIKSYVDFPEIVTTEIIRTGPIHLTASIVVLQCSSSPAIHTSF